MTRNHNNWYFISIQLALFKKKFKAIKKSSALCWTEWIYIQNIDANLITEFIWLTMINSHELGIIWLLGPIALIAK